MKIFRTGLFCLALLWTSTLVRAQAQRDAAAGDQQPAAPQAPAPPQPQQPPEETPAPTQTQPESQRVKLPPAPPKVVDVRMPGEAGYFVGITGWLPLGEAWIDKGHEATFTSPSLLQYAGKAKGAFGAEIGIAAGLHNSIRVSGFIAKRSGNTTAPYDLVLFTQGYTQGDVMSTNFKLSNFKASYEYLTWPYPVEARHFRLKTLWQVQYVSVNSSFDVPSKSATPDSSGFFTSYVSQGTRSFVTPAFGLGFHEYATRNFRFEANFSGFWLPHRFHLLDSDATIGYRAGRIELRGGGKLFIFRTSPNSDFFSRGTLGGLFVGLRWYSD